MEWESFLFACRAAGTSEHVHAAGLDHFETSGWISACIVKEHWEARWVYNINRDRVFMANKDQYKDRGAAEVFITGLYSP